MGGLGQWAHDGGLFFG